MKMKKFLILISAAVMSLCLTACAGEGNSSGNNVEPSQGAETSQSSSTTTETDSNSESSDTSASSPLSEQSEQSAESSALEPNGESGKVLVAYFSATNNTEGVAQKLADGLGADLYEITPEQPYTDEDLDYGNSQSRSSVEMNDPSARPAISGSVENMEQYDVVLIGYPIWWGEAPRIMSTFIESYDFTGKTLAAFCTSASSGFGSSDSALRAQRQAVPSGLADSAFPPTRRKMRYSRGRMVWV